jgi:hypothetical protein
MPTSAKITSDNQIDRCIRIFPTRLLQNSKRRAEADSTFDRITMDYTDVDAKEIELIDNGIAQQASINNYANK